jgi:hypothetical protein
VKGTPFLSEENVMDKSASHRLADRLSLIVLWILAVLLALAWFSAWVLPAF